ncbi:hypothetical protein AYO21_03569 [Fonsecaea monophora]|uniref:Uncharacterized protein n=1 Tax=Fonsecaea monophora TaxID=254056 RepID=A0A177FCZ9_9EURO|nr:hypothetical protein AYO21_03569 [Fonsecaea monophora]OAG42115.1 hypothetical protein AYO21_03569 [Fonsecaea monophora]
MGMTGVPYTDGGKAAYKTGAFPDPSNRRKHEKKGLNAFAMLSMSSYPMSNAKTTRSATSMEGLTFQNTTRARLDAVKETTPPGLSPMQRFMAEDIQVQPWNGLSSGLAHHVTPRKRSPASSTRKTWSILANPSSTDGSVSRVDAVDSGLAVSQRPSGQATGLSRGEHQEKRLVADDLKYVGQIFVEGKWEKETAGPHEQGNQSGSLTSKPSAMDESGVGQWVQVYSGQRFDP